MSDLSDEEFYESELDQSEFIYSSTNGLTTGFLSLYIGKNNILFFGFKLHYNLLVLEQYIWLSSCLGNWYIILENSQVIFINNPKYLF